MGDRQAPRPVLAEVEEFAKSQDESERFELSPALARTLLEEIADKVSEYASDAIRDYEERM